MLHLDLVVELELVLAGGDLECEMNHTDDSCSVEVTHRAIDCRVERFVCAAAARSIVERVASGAVCRHCARAGRDCWRIVPV